ncbi:MAG: DUF58 domain-containing protein [Taibaiella sp.]|nr:DUF58 domain-containing protein [Taibaiella sp.]
MNIFRRYIGDLQVSNRWYLLLGACVILFFVSFFWDALFPVVRGVTCMIFSLTIIDYALLFFTARGIKAGRSVEPRLELGQENEVNLSLVNRHWFRVSGLIIDELPVQFQSRDFKLRVIMAAGEEKRLSYPLKPLTRGEYGFGYLLGYISSPLGLLQRRYRLAEPVTVKVYPAFRQLKKYELQLTATQNNTAPGIKKLRRLGHSLEFEKIKEYVPGDDVRTINWNATARSTNMMVNTFTDARQQQIYCLIDKGRNMKMPFDGMTLLDYSVNAALALLHVALLKQDKAGLITFSNKINDVITADRRSGQLHTIIETLYRQQTAFNESDYEAVWAMMRRRVTQRSLVLLFTNFETFSALERQMPFLRQIAKNHLMCVVFFQNTLLEELHHSQPDDIEGIYIKTIADQFAYDKRQIVKELRRHGILSVLTTPQRLSVDIINKYLELKSQQMV